MKVRQVPSALTLPTKKTLFRVVFRNRNARRLSSRLQAASSARELKKEFRDYYGITEVVAEPIAAVFA
jgi:hypothetical protein